MNQVPEYEKIKSLKSKVDKVKKEYLLGLIELGYVFEQRGSYEDTKYLAIHPNYYLTQDELWEKELKENCYISDGRYNPEDYPEGAFIIISSFCIDDSPSHYINASDFLDEDRCYLGFLGENYETATFNSQTFY